MYLAHHELESVVIIIIIIILLMSTVLLCLYATNVSCIRGQAVSSLVHQPELIPSDGLEK